jgi:hypothetical protein
LARYLDPFFSAVCFGTGRRVDMAGVHCSCGGNNPRAT